MKYWSLCLRGWKERERRCRKDGLGRLVSDHMLAVGAALEMMIVVSVGWFAWARRRWIVPVRLFDVTRLVQ